MTDRPQQFDLNFDFLPDWARRPAQHGARQFEEVREEERPAHRHGQGRWRGERRPDEGAAGRPRRGGDRRHAEARGREERPPRRPDRRGDRRADRRPEYPPVEPAPVEVTFLPYDEALGPIFQQIRQSGRAFQLFDLSVKFLEQPNRYRVRVRMRPGGAGEPAAYLHQCRACQRVALEPNGLGEHIVRDHLEDFFEARRVETEPPKGTFHCVARCRLGGEILGPPNHHEYQGNVRSLHREKYGHMSFEQFRSAVEMAHDPELVDRWIQGSRHRVVYVEKDVAEAPQTFDRIEEARDYVRRRHLPRLLRRATHGTFDGVQAGSLAEPSMREAIRQALREQRRYPLQLSIHLRQAGARRGMHFFKRGKVTFITGIRPTPLPVERIIVSENVRAILDYVRAHPRGKVKNLIEELMPGLRLHEELTRGLREDARQAGSLEAAAATESAGAPPVLAPSGAPSAAPAPGEEPEPAAPPAEAATAPEPAPAASPAEAAAPPAEVPGADAPAAHHGLAPGDLIRVRALLRELDWLVRAGHVIEYWEGTVDVPKPAGHEEEQPPARQKKERTEPPSPRAARRSGGRGIVRPLRRLERPLHSWPARQLPVCAPRGSWAHQISTRTRK